MSLWTWGHRCLFNILISFSLDLNPEGDCYITSSSNFFFQIYWAIIDNIALYKFKVYSIMIWFHTSWMIITVMFSKHLSSHIDTKLNRKKILSLWWELLGFTLWGTLMFKTAVWIIFITLCIASLVLIYHMQVCTFWLLSSNFPTSHSLCP